MRRHLSIALIAITTMVLASCTVGPNYSRPNVPAPPSYRGPDNAPAPADKASLGDEKWWNVFNDPVLQDLIRTAFKQNFDVQIAATRVLQAQSQVTITRSNQFPTV